MTIKTLYLLFAFCTLWHLHDADLSLEVPAIACPNYFQYFRQNDVYVGKLSVPIDYGKTTIALHLSQRGPIEVDHNGSITHLNSSQSLQSRAEKGIPITFEVNFPNPNVLPRVTLISVNDAVICAADEYPAPSSAFSVESNIHLKKNLVSVVTQPFHVHERRKLSNKVKREKSRIEELSDSACGVGGTETLRDEFPWLTLIYEKESDNLKYMCGGTLISLRAVITAAHCFEHVNVAQALVFLGRHNLESYSENDTMGRSIEKVIHHPDYHARGGADADIAILQIQKLESFSQYIKPICLWDGTSNNVNDIAGKSGSVVIWRPKENNSLSLFPKLVNVDIISEVECLRSLSVFAQFITNRTICGRNRDGIAPCIGDSGNGLMLNQNGRWTLRGIVARGLPKNGQCDIGLYCDVAKHLTWVQENS